MHYCQARYVQKDENEEEKKKSLGPSSQYVKQKQ